MNHILIAASLGIFGRQSPPTVAVRVEVSDGVSSVNNGIHIHLVKLFWPFTGPFSHNLL